MSYRESVQDESSGDESGDFKDRIVKVFSPTNYLYHDADHSHQYSLQALNELSPSKPSTSSAHVDSVPQPFTKLRRGVSHQKITRDEDDDIDIHTDNDSDDSGDFVNVKEMKQKEKTPEIRPNVSQSQLLRPSVKRRAAWRKRLRHTLKSKRLTKVSRSANRVIHYKGQAASARRRKSKSCERRKEESDDSEWESMTDTDTVETVSEKTAESQSAKGKGDKSKKTEERQELMIPMQKQLEKTIAKGSARNKLSVSNVKSILRSLITNDLVKDMLKTTLEESSDEPRDGMVVYEPKLTRSRIKEVLQKEKDPKLWPVSPIKLGQPANVGPSILEVEFPDEEDDEYEPSKDLEEVDSDDESLTSSQVSELGSPFPFGSPPLWLPSTPPVPRTPMFSATTPTSLTTPSVLGSAWPTRSASQPELASGSMGPPLAPSHLMQSTKKRLVFTSNDGSHQEEQKNEHEQENIAQAEDDGIARRTRSKLPLTTTSLNDIEEAFVAPDITPDMYDTMCDDTDWQDFLKSLHQAPDTEIQNESMEVGEEDDPEFNYIAEAEQEEMEAEEDLYQAPHRVSRREVTSLIEELEDLFDDDFSFIGMPPKLSTPQTTLPKKPPPPPAAVAVAVAAAGEEVTSTKPTAAERQPSSATEKICWGREQPRPPTPVGSPDDGPHDPGPPGATATAADETARATGNTDVCPGSGDEGFQSITVDCQNLVQELSRLHTASLAGPCSVFNPCNLAGAMGIMGSSSSSGDWPPHPHQSSNSGSQHLDPALDAGDGEGGGPAQAGGKKRAASSASLGENAKPRKRSKLADLQKSLSELQKKVMWRSDVFLYPSLLPPKGLVPPHHIPARLEFSSHEDLLLILGIQQFQHLGKAACFDWIHKLLIPCRTPQQLTRYFNNTDALRKKKNNVVWRYKVKNELPTFPRDIEEFSQDMIKAPCDQPKSLLPKWGQIQKRKDDTEKRRQEREEKFEKRMAESRRRERERLRQRRAVEAAARLKPMLTVQESSSDSDSEEERVDEAAVETLIDSSSEPPAKIHMLTQKPAERDVPTNREESRPCTSAPVSLSSSSLEKPAAIITSTKVFIPIELADVSKVRAAVDSGQLHANILEEHGPGMTGFARIEDVPTNREESRPCTSAPVSLSSSSLEKPAAIITSTKVFIPIELADVSKVRAAVDSGQLHANILEEHGPGMTTDHSQLHAENTPAVTEMSDTTQHPQDPNNFAPVSETPELAKRAEYEEGKAEEQREESQPQQEASFYNECLHQVLFQTVPTENGTFQDSRQTCSLSEGPPQRCEEVQLETREQVDHPSPMDHPLPVDHLLPVDHPLPVDHLSPVDHPSPVESPMLSAAVEYSTIGKRVELGTLSSQVSPLSSEASQSFMHTLVSCDLPCEQSLTIHHALCSSQQKSDSGSMNPKPTRPESLQGDSVENCQEICETPAPGSCQSTYVGERVQRAECTEIQHNLSSSQFPKVTFPERSAESLKELSLTESNSDNRKSSDNTEKTEGERAGKEHLSVSARTSTVHSMAAPNSNTRTDTTAEAIQSASRAERGEHPTASSRVGSDLTEGRPPSVGQSVQDLSIEKSRQEYQPSPQERTPTHRSCPSVEPGASEIRAMSRDQNITEKRSLCVGQSGSETSDSGHSPGDRFPTVNGKTACVGQGLREGNSQTPGQKQTVTMQSPELVLGKNGLHHEQNSTESTHTSAVVTLEDSGSCSSPLSSPQPTYHFQVNKRRRLSLQNTSGLPVEKRSLESSLGAQLEQLQRTIQSMLGSSSSCSEEQEQGPPSPNSDTRLQSVTGRHRSSPGSIIPEVNITVNVIYSPSPALVKSSPSVTLSQSPGISPGVKNGPLAVLDRCVSSPSIPGENCGRGKRTAQEAFGSHGCSRQRHSGSCGEHPDSQEHFISEQMCMADLKGNRTVTNGDCVAVSSISGPETFQIEQGEQSVQNKSQKLLNQKAHDKHLVVTVQERGRSESGEEKQSPEQSELEQQTEHKKKPWDPGKQQKHTHQSQLEHWNQVVPLQQSNPSEQTKHNESILSENIGSETEGQRDGQGETCQIRPSIRYGQDKELASLSTTISSSAWGQLVSREPLKAVDCSTTGVRTDSCQVSKSSSTHANTEDNPQAPKPSSPENPALRNMPVMQINTLNLLERKQELQSSETAIPLVNDSSTSSTNSSTHVSEKRLAPNMKSQVNTLYAAQKRTSEVVIVKYPQLSKGSPSEDFAVDRSSLADTIPQQSSPGAVKRSHSEYVNPSYHVSLVTPPRKTQSKLVGMPSELSFPVSSGKKFRYILPKLPPAPVTSCSVSQGPDSPMDVSKCSQDCSVSGSPTALTSSEQKSKESSVGDCPTALTSSEQKSKECSVGDCPTASTSSKQKKSKSDGKKKQEVETRKPELEVVNSSTSNTGVSQHLSEKNAVPSRARKSQQSLVNKSSAVKKRKPDDSSLKNPRMGKARKSEVTVKCPQLSKGSSSEDFAVDCSSLSDTRTQQSSTGAVKTSHSENTNPPYHVSLVTSPRKKRSDIVHMKPSDLSVPVSVSSRGKKSRKIMAKSPPVPETSCSVSQGPDSPMDVSKCSQESSVGGCPIASTSSEQKKSKIDVKKKQEVETRKPELDVVNSSTSNTGVSQHLSEKNAVPSRARKSQQSLVNKSSAVKKRKSGDSSLKNQQSGKAKKSGVLVVRFPRLSKGQQHEDSAERNGRDSSVAVCICSEEASVQGRSVVSGSVYGNGSCASSADTMLLHSSPVTTPFPITVQSNSTASSSATGDRHYSSQIQRLSASAEDTNSAPTLFPVVTPPGDNKPPLSWLLLSSVSVPVYANNVHSLVPPPSGEPSAACVVKEEPDRDPLCAQSSPPVPDPAMHGVPGSATLLSVSGHADSREEVCADNTVVVKFENVTDHNHGAANTLLITSVDTVSDTSAAALTDSGCCRLPALHQESSVKSTSSSATAAVDADTSSLPQGGETTPVVTVTCSSSSPSTESSVHRTSTSEENRTEKAGETSCAVVEPSVTASNLFFSVPTIPEHSAQQIGKENLVISEQVHQGNVVISEQVQQIGKGNLVILEQVHHTNVQTQPDSPVCVSSTKEGRTGLPSISSPMTNTQQGSVASLLQTPQSSCSEPSGSLVLDSVSSSQASFSILSTGLSTAVPAPVAAEETVNNALLAQTRERGTWNGVPVACAFLGVSAGRQDTSQVKMGTDITSSEKEHLAPLEDGNAGKTPDTADCPSSTSLDNDEGHLLKPKESISDYGHLFKPQENNSEDDHLLKPQENSEDDHLLKPQENSEDDHLLKPQENSEDDHLLKPQENINSNDGHLLKPQENNSEDDHLLKPQENSEDDHLLKPQENINSNDGHLLKPQENINSNDGHLLKPQENNSEDDHLLKPEENISSEDDHLLKPEENISSNDGHLLKPQENISSEDDHLLKPQENINSNDGHLLKPQEDINSEEGHLLKPQEDINSDNGHLLKPQEEVNDDGHLLKPQEDINSDDGHLLKPQEDINSEDGHLLKPQEDINSEDGHLLKPQEDINSDDGHLLKPQEDINSEDGHLLKPQEDNNTQDIKWTREQDKIILEMVRDHGDTMETFESIVTKLQTVTLQQVCNRLSTLLVLLESFEDDTTDGMEEEDS